MSKNSQRDWGRPSTGPWWRYVPKTMPRAVLSLLVDIALFAQSALVLASGSLSNGNAVFEGLVAVLAVALLIQCVDGMRIRKRLDAGTQHWA